MGLQETAWSQWQHCMVIPSASRIGCPCQSKTLALAEFLRLEALVALLWSMHANCGATRLREVMSRL